MTEPKINDKVFDMMWRYIRECSVDGSFRSKYWTEQVFRLGYIEGFKEGKKSPQGFQMTDLTDLSPIVDTSGKYLKQCSKCFCMKHIMNGIICKRCQNVAN